MRAIQMIDSTSVRAHQQAATAKRGRCRLLSRSITRRAHDQDPRRHRRARPPDPARLTAGQAHDGQIADTLLNHLGPRTILLVDNAYDADRIRELIQDQGAKPNIPPKSNRCWKPCFSKRLYRERNLIERFFSKLKHFRCVATRYGKLAGNSLLWPNSPQCACGCVFMSLRPNQRKGLIDKEACQLDQASHPIRFLQQGGRRIDLPQLRQGALREPGRDDHR
ncbi:transposase, IS4 family [Acetobacteraceae bacterium AT-5844]|nr:transposase, IS4 family [Acetobacteraceae bacterium AT-5844]